MPAETPIASGEQNAALLTEFDKIEWRDVCRSIRPDLTDADFDAAWAEFVAIKQRKQLS